MDILKQDAAMAHHFHAVVWIDHQETKIFEFGTDGIERRRIRANDRPGSIHHKSGTVGSGHVATDKSYLSAIADALKPNHEILIVGHGAAKTELAHYIRDHVPALAPRIMGVENIDQQTEGEVIALARKFFEKLDRTMPQR
jgi:stalled ribosome rescue protein Dom34